MRLFILLLILFSSIRIENVWNLKNKETNSYQLIAGYKAFLANKIVTYMKSNKPAIFENYSEQQITEFLKNNMLV